MVVLESLRLVEGHEADALDVLGQLDAGRQLAAGRLVGVEVVDEVGQAANGVLALPVGGEPHEAGDVRDGALALERVGGEEVAQRPGPLEEPLEDGERALAGRLRGQLVEGGEEAAELGPRGRRSPQSRSAAATVHQLGVRRSSPGRG